MKIWLWTTIICIGITVLVNTFNLITCNLIKNRFIAIVGLALGGSVLYFLLKLI